MSARCGGVVVTPTWLGLGLGLGFGTGLGLELGLGLGLGALRRRGGHGGWWSGWWGAWWATASGGHAHLEPLVALAALALDDHLEAELAAHLGEI